MEDQEEESTEHGSSTFGKSNQVKNTIINREVIRRIAVGLGELYKEVVYVGGAVVSLYINDPAADDIRPTKDIDISISLSTAGELETLRQKLIDTGFIQSAEDKVNCRFRFQDILLDVMNIKRKFTLIYF